MVRSSRKRGYAKLARKDVEDPADTDEWIDEVPLGTPSGMRSGSVTTPRRCVPPLLLSIVLGTVLLVFLAASHGPRALSAVRGLKAVQVGGLEGLEGLRGVMSNITWVMKEQETKMPRLCVVARTYGAQKSYIPVFLLSLWHSGFEDISVYLLNTDGVAKTSDLQTAADVANLLVGSSKFAKFLPVASSTTTDYGYGPTDVALQYLYNHPELGCEYITFSNADNVYAANFGKWLRPGLHEGADLLGWDWVSHYQWRERIDTHPNAAAARPHANEGKAHVVTEGSFDPREVAFVIGQIDLAAAMFKMSFLKQHNLTFSGLGEYTADSDGRFIVAAEKLAEKTFIQHATLLLHQ